VVAIFAIAAVALFLSTLVGNRGKSTAAEATPAPLPSGFFKPTDDQWQSLTIAPVRRMEFGASVNTDGTIAAPDDATTQVFSPFTGRVTDVYVTVGDEVGKGTPLFSGEGEESAQALNDLVTAEQTLASAEVQLHITEANRRRLLALLRVDGAARKDVEQSKADLATALTNVRNDETAVALVRSRIRVLGESAGSRPSGKPGSTAPLDTTFTVRSPIAGLVVQRAVGAGQFVDSAANGSSNALLTVTDLSRVFFVAQVAETQIASIHLDDPVRVRMQAFPDREFHARVAYIAPTVDPTSHRIAVRAEVNNPDGLLKPGMFGSFSISSGAGTQKLGVAEDAVIFEGDTARVWIVGPSHTLALRYIKAGQTIDGTVEVLSGLRPGDRVVTSGSVFIDRAAQGDN
jgi:cobalt-zinc-cadmium efflux system membrane fusion protein